MRKVDKAAIAWADKEKSEEPTHQRSFCQGVVWMIEQIEAVKQIVDGREFVALEDLRRYINLDHTVPLTEDELAEAAEVRGMI